MAEKVQNLLNSLKQKPMLPVGIGCLLLFCIDFFIVYFTRVVYSPHWLGQIEGTIVLFAITISDASEITLETKMVTRKMVTTQRIVFCRSF